MEQSQHSFQHTDRPVLEAYVRSLGTPRGRADRALLRVLQDAMLIAWSDEAAARYLDKRHDFSIDAYFLAKNRPYSSSVFGVLRKLRCVRAARLELLTASAADKMFHLRLRNAQRAAWQNASAGTR